MQGDTYYLVLYVPCFGVSFCTVSTSMCLDDIFIFYFEIPFFESFGSA